MPALAKMGVMLTPVSWSSISAARNTIVTSSALRNSGSKVASRSAPEHLPPRRCPTPGRAPGRAPARALCGSQPGEGRQGGAARRHGRRGRCRGGLLRCDDDDAEPLGSGRLENWLEARRADDGRVWLRGYDCGGTAQASIMQTKRPAARARHVLEAACSPPSCFPGMRRIHPGHLTPPRLGGEREENVNVPQGQASEPA
jgi:hypothetical protein